MTNKESGNKMIRKAERIFERDLKSAFEEEDYNLVVRRAQEVVELLLKGILKFLGCDYPKVHDVGVVVAEQMKKKIYGIDEKFLSKIVNISEWLAKERAPAFYIEKDYEKEEALKAFEDAQFLYIEIKKIVEREILENM